jgi:phage shock protein A
MKLFKNWKSRKKIINERDHYQQLLEKERQESARLKQEKSDAEFENQNLEADNEKLTQDIEALRKENEKLQSENLAKRNIIDEERRKHKKKTDTMQKSINKLNAELARLKDKYEPKDDFLKEKEQQ